MSKFDIPIKAIQKMAGVEFIPASKLMSRLKSPDVKVGEDLPMMWARTSAENKPIFKNSIATEGIQKPITINGDWLVDGHHRLIAAFETNPNMLVPVISKGWTPAVNKAKPKTAVEKLFADYLQSGRFTDASTPEEIQKLVDTYGYKQLVKSANDNDMNWLDFYDTWYGV